MGVCVAQTVNQHPLHDNRLLVFLFFFHLHIDFLSEPRSRNNTSADEY